eukprot:TRINITY_DN3928_c0_g1_i2.p1 TRINITY_DN3928_c0_g1~~TRINITY_DN3928_c0_g1_i2.p1  ORF type:complete len:384 (+),score=81.97 TRINITY_DN3928_c0_g1_i2:175-1326(+)
MEEYGFDKLEFLNELQDIEDEKGLKSIFDDEKEIKEALDNKDLFDLRDQIGRTLLHKALMKKEKRYEIEKIRFLIEYKCDMNVPDFFEKTPLHYAFEVDGEYPMEILKEFAYDTNLDDIFGETILHKACKYNQNLKVIKYLIKEKQMDFNLKNVDENLPLIVAIQNTKNLEIVKYFLGELKCDINQKFYDGDNLLHMFCRRSDNVEILKHLVEKKCGVNYKNSYAETPLHHACLYGRKFETIKCLVDLKSDLNQLNSDNNPPLSVAVINHQDVMVIEHLFHKTSFDSEEEKNKVRMLSLYNSNVDIVRFLLDEYKDVDFNQTSVYQRNFSQIANNIDILKYLVDNKNFDLKWMRKARSPEDQGFLSNVNRGRVSRPLRRGRKA